MHQKDSANKSQGERSRYIQYGSGATGPATWRNFDASPTLRIQRLPVVGELVRRFAPTDRPLFEETVEFGDIVAGLPVPDDHCRAIYCSHVLEHLSRQDCRRALENTLRYLEPGGIFRFVMPDLRSLVEAYLADDASDAAHRFMEKAYLGRKSRPHGLTDFAVDWLGNAAHLWMWDFAAMSAELEVIGFSDIRRARFGDSEEPRFSEVETPSRWHEPGLSGEGVIDCLGVECRKPADSR